MQIIKVFFQDIFLGAKDLPGYGNHPGTSILILITLLCGWAGYLRPDGNWITALIAATGGCLIMLPVWILESVDRARSYKADINHADDPHIQGFPKE